MIGIRPTKNEAHWDLELCDRMYDEILKPCTDMAIRPVRCRKGPRSDLDIHSCDCVLVDMDDAVEKSTLNDRLVKCGLADYEPLDRHLLTVNRKAAADTRILNSDKPESWDNEHYRNPQKHDAVFEYNFTDGEIMAAMRSLVNA